MLVCQLQFMLESIITSKTRINLLLKFFLNSKTKSYLRSLEFEFGESSNSVRVELNRLEKAGLLISAIERNKKMFFANTTHPLYCDINNIIKKYIGIDLIISQIFEKIPNLREAYLTGDFASGKNSNVIDFLLAGNNMNEQQINEIVTVAEPLLPRKFRYSIIKSNQHEYFETNNNSFIIWQSKN